MRLTIEIITIEALTPAITIEPLAAECIQMARDRHAKVRTNFNGVALEFLPDSDAVAMVQFYDQAREVLEAQKAAVPNTDEREP